MIIEAISNTRSIGDGKKRAAGSLRDGGLFLGEIFLKQSNLGDVKCRNV